MMLTTVLVVTRLMVVPVMLLMMVVASITMAVMLPVEFGLPMLIAGLVFVWGSEQMVFFEVLPAWYRHLRHLLTAAAVLALVIAWAAAMMSMF